MRTGRAMARLGGLLALAAGCSAAEGFRGTFANTTDAAGTGGFGGAIGAGGEPGGGTGGDTGSGGSGTGGDPGTGGAGTGGVTVDAPADTTSDAGSDAADMRDAPVESAGTLTFENHCLRVRWDATASLYASLAGNAIDGDPGTMWQTYAPQVGREFLQINMGGLVRIGQLVLDNSAGNGTDYPRGYGIQASTDGTNFTFTAASATQGPAGAVTTINFTPIIARAIRIVQTGMDPTFWWTVHELRMGCQPAVAPPQGAIDPFDASHWTVTSSSSIGGSGPGNAIDGDFTTRWTSGVHQQGNEFFLVDLGAPALVSEVWLTTKLSPNDFPAQYVLEVSTNGTQYKQAAAGMGQTVTKIVLTTPATARYVRIKQTGQTPAPGGSWWSIDELSIRP